MQRFKAKTGYELLLPILIFLVGIFGWGVWQRTPKETLLITGFLFILVLSFVLNVFYNTFYTLTDDGKLKIKCGIFSASSIDISTIKSIRKTRNPISSPAPSLLSRIEIAYNKYDAVIISPKDKISFIKAIKAYKPDIEVDLE